MKEAFHITIKDNKNGEVYIDQDTDVIIGVIDEKHKASCGLTYTECKGEVILANFPTLQDAARKSLATINGDETLYRMALVAYLQKLVEEKDED